MARDQLIIDGLDVNDLVTWYVAEEGVQFTPAKKKLAWVGNPQTDGSAQSGTEDHYENAEMEFTVQVVQQTESDTARQVMDALTAKLQNARATPGGIPLVWTPEDSSIPLTWYVLNAEYDEIPTGKESGWSDSAPSVRVHLYLSPFGYSGERLQPLGYSDGFAWNSISGGPWRYETGSGGFFLAVGVIWTVTTALTRMFLPFTATDFVLTDRVLIGSTVSGGHTSLIGRRLDGDNYLRVNINGAGVLSIGKQETSGFTTLTSDPFVPDASTWYWLQASFIGDQITATVFADEDTPLTNIDATPLSTVTYELTGADSTKFGIGGGAPVRGNPGILVDSVGTAAEWQVSEFNVRGMPDIKTSEPMVSFEIHDVPGHVPAEARQIVTEASGLARSHYEWGLEWRDYDPAVASPVILDSGILVSAGFAGDQFTGGNDYNPPGTGTTEIKATGLSATTAVAICGTGEQPHVGIYRVKARVNGDEGVRLRLAWRVGDGRRVRNNFTPGKALDTKNQEFDLGTIIIPPARIGDQSWDGQVEAYSPLVAGGYAGVDYLEIIPLERWGAAIAPLRPVVATSFKARDEFASGTAAALHGQALPIGGFWDTDDSTATGDFSKAPTIPQVRRLQTGDASLAAGRYAIAKDVAPPGAPTAASSYAAVRVQADLAVAVELAKPSAADVLRFGVVARYVDTNNWLMAVRQNVDEKGTQLRVYKRKAGAFSLLATHTFVDHINFWRTVVLVVHPLGIWEAYVFPQGSRMPSQPQLRGEDGDLATGGALASGRVGLYDAYTPATGVTRAYNNFIAFTAEQDVVVFPNRRLEIRSDGTQRESEAGGDWGRVPEDPGQRFFVPAAGDAGRTSRVVAKMRRSNVAEGLPDSVFSDSGIWAVNVTPRYLTPIGGEDTIR